ncbi:MAG: hypothetical protein ACM3VT_15485, partial [Solirubrobacterales bacterium]
MMCRRIGAVVVSTALAMILMGESPAIAQPSAVVRPNAGPRPSTQSPEIAADRRVTFRLQAEKAGEVSIVGQWSGEQIAMTKTDGQV